MKYLIFIFLLVGYSTLYAQVSPLNSNASVSIILKDALELIPEEQFTYLSTFSTAADYNGVSAAKDFGGPKTWTIKSTKSGNMQVKFRRLASTTLFIPVNNITYSTTGGGSYTAATGTLQPAGTFNAGVQSYQLYLQFNPGWGNYPADTYSGYLELTATQN